MEQNLLNHVRCANVKTPKLLYHTDSAALSFKRFKPHSYVRVIIFAIWVGVSAVYLLYWTRDNNYKDGYAIYKKRETTLHYAE